MLSVGRKDSKLVGGSWSLPGSLDWRTTVQGVFVGSDGTRPEYMELGTRGLVYLERELPLGTIDSRRALYLSRIVNLAAAFLSYSEGFYKAFGWIHHILLDLRINGIRGLAMTVGIDGYQPDESLRECQDEDVKLYGGEHRASDLMRFHDEIIIEIICSLAWAFGLTVGEGWARNVLSRLRGEKPK